MSMNTEKRQEKAPQALFSLPHLFPIDMLAAGGKDD